MKKIFFKLLIILPVFSYCQIINFSDSNFKNALLNNNCVDTDNNGFGDTNADSNNDGEIQLSEAEAIIGLHLFSSDIQSMNEISNFVNLQQLSVVNNSLTNLDVSLNANLIRLHVFNNYQLSDLQLPQTNTLDDLKCFNNVLSSLDISNNPNLTILHCYANVLVDLDISQNLILEELAFGGSTNTNQITSIDVTQHLELKLLHCSNNSITNLDLSQNINLEELHCSTNNLNQLDLSMNPSLTSLDCYSNELTFLNIKNGNNNNLSMLAFNNPDLTCIEVDDVNFANNSNWNINNTQAQYNLDCNNLSVLEYVNLNFKFYPNPTNSTVKFQTNESIEKILVYSITGKLVMEKVETSVIDLSEFQSGIYFFHIMIDKKNVKIKIIKE